MRWFGFLGQLASWDAGAPSSRFDALELVYLLNGAIITRIGQHVNENANGHPRQGVKCAFGYAGQRLSSQFIRSEYGAGIR